MIMNFDHYVIMLNQSNPDKKKKNAKLSENLRHTCCLEKLAETVGGGGTCALVSMGTESSTGNGGAEGLS